MRVNLEATHGLLFADAVAARLAPKLGREEAHRLVEKAAEAVRDSGTPLQDVMQRMAPIPVDDAFDLSSSIAAAGAWVDRALSNAARIRDILSSDR
jgi:3-carboxy-cis,cis-muconate cycloisomerase